jgi:hypothetical protein
MLFEYYAREFFNFISRTCLARQKEDRISLPFYPEQCDFQKEGGNPPHFKSS